MATFPFQESGILSPVIAFVKLRPLFLGHTRFREQDCTSLEAPVFVICHSLSLPIWVLYFHCERNDFAAIYTWRVTRHIVIHNDTISLIGVFAKLTG